MIVLTELSNYQNNLSFIPVFLAILIAIIVLAVFYAGAAITLKVIKRIDASPWNSPLGVKFIYIITCATTGYLAATIFLDFIIELINFIFGN
jgi:hypothetical protein